MTEQKRHIWKPYPFFLSKADHPRIYELEEKRNNTLSLIAEELRDIMEGRLGRRLDFWHEVMVQVLYDVLESYDPTVAKRAAKIWLSDNEDVRDLNDKDID